VTPPGVRITTADVPSDARLALSPGEVAIESIAHACFRNTMWLVEIGGLRIAHLGDNGPLTEQSLHDLSHVDIPLIPIDAQEHILKNHEVQSIRRALRPRVLIPMHYRYPNLEDSDDSPKALGPIDPWLADQKHVARLERHYVIFASDSLNFTERIVVLCHSPKVRAEARWKPER
jgi:L-ascorbate metabolism protein UlaG (beta-lactamase superfamily)